MRMRECFIGIERYKRVFRVCHCYSLVLIKNCVIDCKGLALSPRERLPRRKCPIQSGINKAVDKKDAKRASFVTGIKYGYFDIRLIE